MPNFEIINQSDNPNVGRNKINYNFSILSGAGFSIGGLVSGGTPTQVLYTDDNGNLFSDSGFTRDSSFSATTILTNDYYLDKQFGLIIGEYGGLSGASIFEINTDSNTGNIIGINESLSQDGL